jgi:hypothetical protein
LETAEKTVVLRSQGLDMFLTEMGIKGRVIRESDCEQPFGIVSVRYIDDHIADEVEMFARGGGTVMIDGSYLADNGKAVERFSGLTGGLELVHSETDPVASLLTSDGNSCPLNWVVVNESQEQVIHPLILIPRSSQSQNGFIRRSLGKGYVLLATFCPFLNIGWALSAAKPESWIRKYGLAPVVDIVSQCITGEVVEAFHRRGVPFVRIWPWPEGKKAVLGLSHDVDFLRKDLLFYLRDALDCARRLRIGNMLRLVLQAQRHLIKREDPYQSVEKIAAFERHLEANSTFFLLGDRRDYPFKGSNYDPCEEDVTELVARFRIAGFEFSLHASFQSFDDGKIMARDVLQFSKCLSFKPKGVRQHFLNFTRPKTWLLQDQLGFEYDSSLGSNQLAGYVLGTSFPFFPLKGSDLLELPITLQDRALLDSRFQGLSTEAAEAFLDELVDVACRSSGMIIVNWHNNAWDDVGYQGWSDLYYCLLQRAVKKNFWMISLQKISSWWKERREALQESVINASAEGTLRTFFNSKYRNLTLCIDSFSSTLARDESSSLSKAFVGIDHKEFGCSSILIWKSSWEGNQVEKLKTGDKRQECATHD